MMKSKSLILQTLQECKLEKENLIDFLEEYASFGIDDIDESIQVHQLISMLKNPSDREMHIDFDLIETAINNHLINCRFSNHLQRPLDEDRFFSSELAFTRIELFGLKIKSAQTNFFS